MTIEFAPRGDKTALEEGAQFSPKFDDNGLLPCVTTDYETGEALMFAFMNEEALRKTIEIGEAVYWSRSRGKLWHKGETSGQTMVVREMRIDCDQDCLWLRVTPKGGAACHTGFRSCFYRAVPFGEAARENFELTFTETDKVFDPKEVYGK